MNLEAYSTTVKNAVTSLVHDTAHHMRLWRNTFRLGRLRMHPPQAPLSVVRDAQLDALLQGSASQFERIVRPYVDECKWPLAEVYNGFFESLDAEFYYCAVRTWRPRRIIEIGSGWATRFALRAVARNGRGEVLCIDPEPRRRLPATVAHTRSKVEDVDPRVFDDLGADDILFIDSSHTREEAEYHVTHILPRLQPGVTIHHHDIMYPYAYLFDEEEVVFDFYQRHTGSFEILTSLAFARHSRPDLCLSLVPSYRRVAQRVPGSLWTRKKRG